MDFFVITILTQLWILIIAVDSVPAVVINANIGEPVLLPCDIRTDASAGNVTSMLYWITPDNATLPMDANNNGSSLYISTVKESDAGSYTCVDNSTGEAISYTVELTVLSQPLSQPKSDDSFDSIKDSFDSFIPMPVVEATNTTLNVSWDSDPNQAAESSQAVFQLHVKQGDNEVYSSELPESRMWLLVEQLKPYTLYDVIISVSNSSAVNNSKIIQTRTTSGAPTEKPSITKYTASKSVVYIEWEPPPISTWNGDIFGFNVIHEDMESGTRYETSIPHYIEYPSVINGTITIVTNITKDVKPGKTYRIQVNAFTEGGAGPYADIIVETVKPLRPVTPELKCRSGRVLHVDWSNPSLDYLEEPRFYNISWSDDVTEEFALVEGTDYRITGLLPHTMYNVAVVAIPNLRPDVSVLSDPHEDYVSTRAVKSFTTDVEGPSPPLMVNVTSNQSTFILVSWSRPQNFTVRIDEFRIRYRNKLSKTTKLLILKNVDLHRDIYEAAIGSCQPNSMYEVEVAGATKSLFTEQLFVGPFSQVIHVLTAEEVVESNSALWIIFGVLAAFLLIIIIIIMVVCVRYCLNNRYQFVPDQDSSKNGPECFLLTQIYDPKTCSTESIPVEKFEEHVMRLHADGDYQLSQEYEEINRNVPSNVSTRHSCDDENKHKNRYLNILAYDHSRVILKQISGKPRQTDYINANYIDGYKKQQAFIATQGPLPSTFGDFWRMVWEQNSSVIVMITNLTEKGRRKCDQYWPSEGEHQYDSLVVKFLSSDVTAHYTVTKFSLRQHKQKKKLDGERIVVHYHYTDWPDHGVPAFAIPTLTFVTRSIACNAEGSGPIVVHCSAGVGRTGTYIVIDSMMRQINDLKTVNVFGFLSHIRAQRNFLVQTEDQYSFIHEVLLEYVLSGDTEIHDVNHIRNLLHSNNSINSLDPLHTQYMLVTRFQPRDFHLTSAKLAVNESKNRSQVYLPVEIARVYLPMKAGVEGSDYINASYFQGCSRNDEFIITQHPLSSTRDDFWHMVWDQNSKVIVLISSSHLQNDVTEEERSRFSVETFWPQASEGPMDCGQFKVTHKQEYKVNDETLVIELLLQSSEDDFELVQIIQNSNWLDGTSASASAVDFARLVGQNIRQCDNNDVCNRSPTVVIDWYGGADAAMLCGLITLDDELKRDGCVNVYTLAKLYHMKRPHVFPSLENYQFLYECVEVMFEEYRHSGGNFLSHGNDTSAMNCKNHVDGLEAASPSAVSLRQNLLEAENPSKSCDIIIHNHESNGGNKKHDELI